MTACLPVLQWGSVLQQVPVQPFCMEYVVLRIYKVTEADWKSSSDVMLQNTSLSCSNNQFLMSVAKPAQVRLPHTSLLLHHLTTSAMLHAEVKVS